MRNPITNTFLSDEVPDKSPDAEDDFFKIADLNRNTDYVLGRALGALSALSMNPGESYHILYGGKVEDAGSGAINITEGMAIGTDENGSPRLVIIAAQAGIPVPTGLRDGRQIWVIGEHQWRYSADAPTAHYNQTPYHRIVEDSFTGETDTDLLFTDSDPFSGPESRVVWGSFTLNGSIFESRSSRTREYQDDRRSAGFLQGGITRRGNNPPSIAVGTYEVAGRYVKVEAKIDLSFLDHCLGDSAAITNCHYAVTLEGDGKPSVVPLFGNSILTGIAIQSIEDVGGGVFNVRVLNGADLSLLHAGCLSVMIDTPDQLNVGVLECLSFDNNADSGGSGEKVLQIQNSRGIAQSAAGGTISFYHRVESVDIIPDVRNYVPLLPGDETLRGFYSQFMSMIGRTGRVIGQFFVNEFSVVEPSRVHSAGSCLEWAGSEGRIPGNIDMYSLEFAPPGWLECNGQAISRSEFSALFDAIGTTHGSGDGSTTFNVPDMRGEFPRGWDNGRGVDPGRVLGSSQDHQIEDHEHFPKTATDFHGQGSGPSSSNRGDGLNAGSPTTGGATAGNVGSETRPRNVALMFCIKY